MMIYRWRQEYRGGQFVEEPSKRIGTTKDTPSPKKSDDKINEKMMRLSALRKN
jgi:hypothetical protein